MSFCQAAQGLTVTTKVGVGGPQPAAERCVHSLGGQRPVVQPQQPTGGERVHGSLRPLGPTIDATSLMRTAASAGCAALQQDHAGSLLFMTARAAGCTDNKILKWLGEGAR